MDRPERLEDQIQFIISNLIQREVRDPDLGFLTVTAVRVTPDKSIAKVYFTVLPTDGRTQEAQNSSAQKILDKSRGFLRTRLAVRLTMRRVPQIIFVCDESVSTGNKMEALFAELEKERTSRPPSDD